jgi:hypothetical protein
VGFVELTVVVNGFLTFSQMEFQSQQRSLLTVHDLLVGLSVPKTYSRKNLSKQLVIYIT